MPNFVIVWCRCGEANRVGIKADFSCQQDGIHWKPKPINQPWSCRRCGRQHQAIDDLIIRNGSQESAQKPETIGIFS